MAFQSFEVVSIASVDSLSRQPRLSDAAMMVARVMLGHGYEPRMGLGKNKKVLSSYKAKSFYPLTNSLAKLLVIQ